MTGTEGSADSWVLGPLRRTAAHYRRRRHRDLDPLSRSMLEAVGYRRSMFDFMAATHRNPSILSDARIDEHSTVIDAGGYLGEWSEEIVRRYGSRVFVFEPAPVFFAEIQARLGSMAQVSCVPAGLGRADGTCAMSVTGPGSRVVTDRSAPGVVNIEMRDVAAVLTGLGVDRVNLMKLNIEGGEFDVLERLDESGWLDRVDELLIQFHERYPGAPRRRRRIRRSLARTHIEEWNFPWVWERWVRRTPTT